MNFGKIKSSSINDLKKSHFRGAWVAQSVEHLTLDLGSGHGPRIVESSPVSGSILGMEPAWNSFSLSLSQHLSHLGALSLKKKKKKKSHFSYMEGTWAHLECVENVKWVRQQVYTASIGSCFTGQSSRNETVGREKSGGQGKYWLFKSGWY